MAYQKELSNLNNPETGSLFVNFINTCRKNSIWIQSGGAQTGEFIDFDEFLFDGKKAEALSREISDTINSLIEHGYDFERIGFIEKINGTIGVIALQGSILAKVNKPGIIIRPKKKIINTAIKGELNKGDRVLILSDVATSGESIFSAAEIVWAYGGKVPYALVALDRLQGATQNLLRKGIQLFSQTSSETLNEKKSNEISAKIDIPSPVFRDFISSKNFVSSSTTVAL